MKGLGAEGGKKSEAGPGLKQEQRRSWGAEGVEQLGLEALEETEGRWPTEAGKAGVEADAAGREWDQQWAEETWHQSASVALRVL